MSCGDRCTAISRRWLWSLLVAVSALLPGIAVAEIPVPPLKSRVTDLTATLGSDERASLESRLRDFEHRRGSQIAVLIVPTTQPETIEQYSIRVVENWKLGRKRIDDGALLIIAKNDRKLRIEVGRGVEGAIPDVVAKRIISEVIVPRFKEGDFYGGITAGTDRILRLIEGEPLPPSKSYVSSPAAEREPARTAEGGLEWWLILIFFLLSIGYAVYRLWRLFVAVIAGLVVGGASAVIIDPLWGLALGLGAFVALIAYFDGIRWGGDLDFTSGSGGDFAGGGGDFGGGGASGSW